MSAVTKIEWTDRSWNPTRGCSRKSSGCLHCYAERQAHRFSGPGQPYEGLTRMTSHGPVWTGKIMLVHEAIEEPLRWRKPSFIFVNSMSDLFHDNVPDEFIDKVFAVMCRARHHTFQILTKCPSRMQLYLSNPKRREAVFLAGQEIPLCARESPPPWPLPNVWMGVSVENQETADVRILYLMQAPAAIRWLSCEPLLGPIDLRSTDHQSQGLGAFNPDAKVDWVVVGGESGPGARSTVIGHIRQVVNQCQAAGVPVFVKQLGAKPTNREGVPHPLIDRKGGDINEFPIDLQVREYPHALQGAI